MHAGKSRLFGCFFTFSERSVQGLVGLHAYSILRVREYKGKRFVILRNPWGYYEWQGPWSDGSAEWTDEWMGLRKELDHKFGDDGQFIMECTSSSFIPFSTPHLLFVAHTIPILFSFI
jgi:Calpain family cysteine protease